jgi:hypothetical protein
MGAQWSFVRETPADWSLTSSPGSLVITPKQGDLNAGTNTARNILLQPALGDWTMTSKLTFSARPNAATQQGGIIAYGDDNNYLKFDLEAISATNIQFNTTLEDSFSGSPIAQVLNTLNANAILPASNTIWLRMTKNGPFYSTFYSLDGATWVPVWTTGATLKNVRAGVFAYNRNGTTTSLQVAFDFFHITPTVALSDAHGWLGLKNGDDQGTLFDLRVELLKNGNPVASGMTRCISGVTRNPASAKEAVVPWDVYAPVPLASGDVLALRFSTRIGTKPDGTKCAGHNSAVGVRLYYDAANRSSRTGATVGAAPGLNLYLHSDGAACINAESVGVNNRYLDSNAPVVAPAKCKDAGTVNFAGGNRWVTIGTWSLAPQ